MLFWYFIFVYIVFMIFYTLYVLSIFVYFDVICFFLIYCVCLSLLKNESIVQKDRKNFVFEG